jgi:hypothetical protein
MKDTMGRFAKFLLRHDKTVFLVTVVICLFMGTAGYFGVADAVKSWENEKQYYHGQTLDHSKLV